MRKNTIKIMFLRIFGSLFFSQLNENIPRQFIGYDFPICDNVIILFAQLG